MIKSKSGKRIIVMAAVMAISISMVLSASASTVNWSVHSGSPNGTGFSQSGYATKVNDNGTATVTYTSTPWSNYGDGSGTVQAFATNGTPVTAPDPMPKYAGSQVPIPITYSKNAGIRLDAYSYGNGSVPGVAGGTFNPN